MHLGITCRQEFKRFFTAWIFQPMPFPMRFPPVHPMPAGTPSSQVPRGLLFGLGGDHLGYAANPSFSLLVLSATAQLVPVRVLKMVTVPQHVYAHLLPAPPKRPIESREPSMISASGIDAGVAAFHQQGPQRAQQQEVGSHTKASSGNAGAAEEPDQAPEEAAAGAMARGAAAQRAMFQALSAIVHWCHGRMVWEQLTHQLTVRALCQHAWMRCCRTS